jgi:hypothetical protein
MDDTHFTIYFKNRNETFKIYPNGRYSINTFAAHVYGSNKWGGDGEERLKFILGKYICNTPCFYDMVESNSMVINKNVTILATNNKDNFHFIISTFNGENKFFKETINALLIGLISGATIYSIESFVNYLRTKINGNIETKQKKTVKKKERK